MTEILDALREQYRILGVKLPWGMVSDDCCKVRTAVQRSLIECLVFLDI